jgi:hypothetical protein
MANDDGPGRPVSRDEPYYPAGGGLGLPVRASCHLCDAQVPVVTSDYRHFVMRAIKAGWKLAKLTTGDEWTCPACAAVARAHLDAAVMEEAREEE